MTTETERDRLYGRYVAGENGGPYTAELAVRLLVELKDRLRGVKITSASDLEEQANAILSELDTGAAVADVRVERVHDEINITVTVMPGEISVKQTFTLDGGA